MCILEEGDALCPQAPHDISLIPHCHSIHLHHRPQWDPTYTIPLKPTQPHTIPTHPIPQHHAPTPSIPTPSAPIKDLVQVPPVGHAQPPHASLDTLLPSEAQGSHIVPRSCREERRQGAPDRVCGGEWCRGCTVPCLCPLSILEGGTPFTGHQPITQGDLGWPGPRLCEGGGDFRPRPRPNKKTNGIQPPMALSSPGF